MASRSKDGQNLHYRQAIPLYGRLPAPEELEWERDNCYHSLVKELMASLPRKKRFAVLISEHWWLEGLSGPYEKLDEVLTALTQLPNWSHYWPDLVYEVMVELTAVKVEPVIIKYPAWQYCPCLWHTAVRWLRQRLFFPALMLRYRSKRASSRWAWLVRALALEAIIVCLVALWR